MPLSNEQLAARLRTAADLRQTGIWLQRQRLARTTAGDSALLAQRLKGWLGYHGFEQPAGGDLEARPPRPLPHE